MSIEFKKFYNKILLDMKTFEVTIDHILVYFIGSKLGLYISFLIRLYLTFLSSVMAVFPPKMACNSTLFPEPRLRNLKPNIRWNLLTFSYSIQRHLSILGHFQWEFEFWYSGYHIFNPQYTINLTYLTRFFPAPKPC